MAERGLLVLVVGASGVGKDTLLDAAREMLAGDARFFFPQREITRPTEAGGEAHVAVDWETFRVRRTIGAYALAWEAHGLGYGVSIEIATALAAGRRVVVNVSRTVIDAARARFAPVRVINVTAPSGVLAERLARRGREAGEDIEARLARAATPVEGDDVVDVANDASLAEGVERFVAALRG